ncbi:MAG: NCS1 family transporter [Angelakisella sp.]|nr:NCS1 family transporter [Angelakisella sp.]
MSTENKVTVDSAANIEHTDTLAPIPAEKRILGLPSYTFMWLGGCISIGTFTLGSSYASSGLNLIQIAIAICLGSLILIAGLVLNDKMCYTTGIPYVYQLRNSFGAKGSVLPAVLRALPALIWFGVQSWLAGSALNEVSKTLFGWNNMIFWFVAFQLLQLVLALTGFKGIKWVENVGACFIICALFYMFYVCMSQYGDVIGEKLLNIEGTWGMPFISAIVSFLGVNILVMCNCGDYARELKVGYGAGKRTLSYFLAMVPTTLFMGLIGMMISTATGIANPIVAFSSAVENKFLVVVTLIFIIFAQMTTNLLSNAIPPVYALMDICKLKHAPSVIITCILTVCTFPWLLVSEQSAAGLDLFVLLYTVFFGPVAAIMLVDYYLIRKRKVDVSELYKQDGKFSGVNWAAIAAVAVGAAVGFINVSMSFFISFIPTALVYYFVLKNSKKLENFRYGSIFEK